MSKDEGEMDSNWKGITREDANQMVGPGWAPLIDAFYAHVKTNTPNIYKKTAEHDKTVKVVQVKEKLGRLRIYFSGGDDFLRGFSEALDIASGLLCEECGQRGRVNYEKAWYRTQCKDHWDGPGKY